MRTIAFALCLLCAVLTRAASTEVPVRLISLSVQIQPTIADDPFTGLEWHASVSAFTGADPNGELELADADLPYTHASFFILIEPTTLEPIPVAFAVDVPDDGDVNHNGLPDFWDQSLGVEGHQTEGLYLLFGDQVAELSATWNRAPGEAAGTVLFDLPDLGLSFTHAYSVPAYTGLLTCTPSNAVITGSLTLTNTTNPEQTIAGPFSLQVNSTNQLTYAPGVWQGADGTLFHFQPVDPLDLLGTNFVSIAFIEDGFTASPEPDYQFWLLSLEGTDQNGNGIPDLVEDQGEPPAAPILDAVRGVSGVRIKIQGTAGATYTIEASPGLANPAWSPVETISMPQSTAALEYAADGNARFFRVRQGD